MPKPSVCIIIPAYNEEGSIASVISLIRKSIKNSDWRFHLLVVNDNSLDKTKEIAEQLGVSVLDLPFNLGIGGAVQTGLRYAQENGYDVALQIDADGQHNPRYIPKLLKKLNKNVDMIIGSRYAEPTDYKSPFMRRLGNRVFSGLIQFTCGEKVYDTTSGYRIFNKKAISFLAKYYPADFPEPESIVKLLKNGFAIKEVPVEMNKRSGGKSSVTPLKAIYFMLSISIAILTQSIRTKKLFYVYK